MLANKSEIQNLIPQSPPMAMVDGLIASDEQATTSRLNLDKTNLFCRHGFFHEPGLVENMAQTVALRGGYRARQEGKSPLKGFIGSIKRFSIYHLPADNDTLTTTITITNRLFNAFVIKGEVFVDGRLMAKGEMNIFEQE